MSLKMQELLTFPGAHPFTLGVSGVLVARSLVFCLMVCGTLLFFVLFRLAIVLLETLSRNERGRLGALKSDSTHHFFRNACTKLGSLRFHSFPVAD